RLLALFLIAGLAGELAQSLAVADSHLPMIGASGGTAGLLGAYLLLFPRANILTLAVLWRRSAVVGIPAILVIGVWLVLEIASLHAPDQDAGGTAAVAHLAGFVAGLVLIAVARPSGIPLLQPARSRAFAISRQCDQVPQL
ncbi:MAG: rhomboid family intramembrane serine protease, partial [Geminicoccaceae bacterium]